MRFSPAGSVQARKLPDITRKFLQLSAITTIAICAVLYAKPTLAAGHDAASAKATYLKDRELCNSGQTNQDRATCLKEAAAAYAEAKRGQLNNDGSYDKNAVDRCKALHHGERSACYRRIKGEGTTDGSVEEGGIYRRIETEEGPAHHHRYRTPPRN
ncbi:MAG: hypothetical protein H6R01_703 [Burkholderiaceae bacterium]|nr:hypothetical protein [Burkholderiaceae bacterium]